MTRRELFILSRSRNLRGTIFLDGSWRIFEGLSRQASNGLLRDSRDGENAAQNERENFSRRRYTRGGCGGGMTGSLQEQWEHRSGHSCVLAVSRSFRDNNHYPNYYRLFSTPHCLLIVSSIHLSESFRYSTRAAPFDSWPFTRKHRRNRSFLPPSFLGIATFFPFLFLLPSSPSFLQEYDISRGL